MTSIDCCHKCKTRSVGCHSACERYLRLRAQRDAELDARIEANDAAYHAMIARKKVNRAERDRRYRENKKRREQS